MSHPTFDAPVLAVSHGAATLTVRDHDPTRLALARVGDWLAGSRAVAVISAHDVREEVTVGSASTVPLMHDHPAATGLAWTAPGDPALAAWLAALLEAPTGPVRLDHGAWVPLRALDPKGHIPVVTISLASSLDPQRHVALGRTLRVLRQEGVALITSGGTTHNQQAFRRGWFAGEPVDRAEAPSRRFAAWVLETLGRSDAVEQLLQAEDHPDYAWSHPTPDHWLPTLIAAAAAEGRAASVLHTGFQHSLSTALVGWR